MNRVDRYLDNLKEPALRQIIKLLLKDVCCKHKGKDHNGTFVNKQIEEFHRMYPGDV
jgi:hypothetical protein